MINKINKYGDLSGGYIYDFFDKKCHEIAISIIGECETIQGDINYFGKINENDLDKNVKFVHNKIGENKVLIIVNCLNKIYAKFIFIKRKIF